MTEEELESRRQLTKKTKELERKVKLLEKEVLNWREQWKESYRFEVSFRRFYNRFDGRKYDSQWPIERVVEALFNLKEKLG